MPINGMKFHWIKQDLKKKKNYNNNKQEGSRRVASPFCFLAEDILIKVHHHNNISCLSTFLCVCVSFVLRNWYFYISNGM